MITITCDKCGKEICKTISVNTAIGAIHNNYNCGNPKREVLCNECKSLEFDVLPCPICLRKPEVLRPYDKFGYNGYVVECDGIDPGYIQHRIEIFNNDIKIAVAAWNEFASVSTKSKREQAKYLKLRNGDAESGS